MARFMAVRTIRLYFALLTTCISLSYVPRSSAQIIELREKDGRQIGCATSGLSGFGSFCGLDNEFYSYILLATIISVDPIANDEFRVHLQADEIFRGEPVTEIFAVTNQGLCLPNLQPGDQWLAYLRHEPERGQVLAYENESRPLKGAEDELTRLRRLKEMNDSALLMGDVNMPHSDDDGWHMDGPVADYKIIATAKNGSAAYQAISDATGHFEFESLPAGDYWVSSNTGKGVHTADEGNVQLKAHGCMKLNIDLQPDGILSGRVTSSDGKPAASVKVFALSANDEGKSWSSERTDASGSFTFNGVQPGRYLLGVGAQNAKDDSDPEIAVYFPNALSRDSAFVITLGNAEHREGINLVIPATQ